MLSSYCYIQRHQVETAEKGSVLKERERNPFLLCEELGLDLPLDAAHRVHQLWLALHQTAHQVLGQTCQAEGCLWGSVPDP
jgi:hypothetical protein